MVIWALLALWGCASPEPAGGLGPQGRLARISLDLRGVRPSLADLERVSADPTEEAVLVEEYLHDPRFEGRVADWFALAYRTRLDRFTPDAEEFGLTGAADPQFQAAIGNEPLRLLGHVAANDLPWTTVVTADYTLTDSVLGAVWPVDYPSTSTGWQPVKYTDGRPAAGVLATNGLWWRYTSTMENFNRGRANALSRILLCNDFLVRPVNFPRTDDVDLLDQTRTNPACTACHHALDPLGSALYGFDYFYEGYYMTPEYNPHAEQRWRGGTGIPPAYFGEPVADLSEVGAQIAGDPRFISCTVEQVFTGLLHRDAVLDDFPRLVAHRQAFVGDEQLRLRTLVRSVVSDPAYLGEPVEGAARRKVVPVEVLASSVEEITGFRWTAQGYDMLTTDTHGLRALGGGFDGSVVTRPVRTVNPTVVLVQQRLAELAAAWAVAHDSARGGPLFGEGVPGPAALDDDVIAVIEQLTHRVLSRPAAPHEAVGLLGLWKDTLEATESADLAWTVVLSALLRHPDFLLY